MQDGNFVPKPFAVEVSVVNVDFGFARPEFGVLVASQPALLVLDEHDLLDLVAHFSVEVWADIVIKLVDFLL